MSDHWFAVDKLERAARALDRENAGGDFGSYAKANRTGSVDGPAIATHNLIHAAHRVRLYRHILPRRDFASIADIGCGLGLTTAALAREFAPTCVTGYDISPDAIEFARRRFPAARFVCQGIDSTSDLGGTFDLILCQEFYPFTRTPDWAVQQPMIESLLKKLNQNGWLVIELSERDPDRTILANLNKLVGFRPLLRRLPYDRVHRRLGWIRLSILVSASLARLTGRDRNMAILLNRK